MLQIQTVRTNLIIENKQLHEKNEMKTEQSAKFVGSG